MDEPQSSPGPSRLPACVVALLLCVAAPLVGQNRHQATTAAPFLKEPAGLRLGSLVSGVSYLTGRAASGHLETTVEGWLPAGSTSPTTRDGFDLTVIAGGGEAIRATPNGAIVARVQEGTLLSKAGTRGTWIRVRRAGWVPRGSFERAENAAASPPAPTTVAANPPTARPPAPATTPPVRAATAPAPPPPPATDSGQRKDAPSEENVSSRGTVRQGAAIHRTPDGARIGTVEAAEVRLLERQREWIRVSLEGWVRSSDVTEDAAAGPAITGAMVRERPDRFVGQVVSWRIQYLAVLEADDLRPEMPRGQPYVLARGPLPEPGFVYLMVTKEQAAEFRARSPLDEVSVDAVIRAGRTKYLPTPVLELKGLAAR